MSRTMDQKIIKPSSKTKPLVTGKLNGEMEKKYVASIDAGTSSVRIILFDKNGNIVRSHAKELNLFTEHTGYVEQDPIEIIYLVSLCMKEILNNNNYTDNIDISEIASVGITNQRETTIIWDKDSGKPLHNAIVWQDVRNSDTVKQLINENNNNKDCFRNKCGLPLSTYFSATKIKWLYDNKPIIKNAIDNKQCKFGTVDSWIMFHLLNGKHITDVTNASRTMLMNLKTLNWDNSLCKSFGIPPEILPIIAPSSYNYGIINKSCNLNFEPDNEKIISGINFAFSGLSLTGVIGDQQAATLGQLCLNKGNAKNTYGTGAFLLYNTGKNIINSKSGLLTTVLYQFETENENIMNWDNNSDDYITNNKNGKSYHTAYALEGSIAVAGQISKWLKDNLGMVNNPMETSEFASKVDDTGGVYFVTAFSGLFAPYWRDDVRGLLTGLTLHTKREHICRAALEAVCHRTCEVVNAMENDSGIPVNTLRVDGGMAKSNIMLQMQCELLQVPVIRPKMIETTAMGAAIASGIKIGFWKNFKDLQNSIFGNKIKDSIQNEKIFIPSNNKKIIEKVKKRRLEWQEAVQKTIGFDMTTEMKELMDDNDSSYSFVKTQKEKMNNIIIHEDDYQDNQDTNTNNMLKNAIVGIVIFTIGVGAGYFIRDHYIGQKEKK